MYFPEKYSQPNPVDLEALIWFPYLPMPVSTPFDLEPIRPRHIKTVLQSKKPTSAPGPDGIMYGILRKLPATYPPCPRNSFHLLWNFAPRA